MSISNSEPEDIVAFTVLGLTPPSVNHVYQPTMYTGRDGYAHRGRKLSDEAKAFKYAVAIFARGRTVTPRKEKERKRARYSAEINVVLGPGQRGDEDNFYKVGIDALTYAGVIHTDAFLTSKVNVIRDDRTHPRTEYLVTRLETK